MQHHLMPKSIDQYDDAITLEEWHRDHDAVEPRRATQVIRHHEHDLYAVA